MRWFAMSTRFLTDPKVEALGEKHGPAGPLVVVSLLSHAGQQEAGGRVERTFRAIANETFIERDEAVAIVDTIIEGGVCHAVSRDVTGCLLEFPNWDRYQAAFRKARSRASKKEAEKPHGKANVTDGHGESRDVTNKTRQDKGKEVVADRDSAPLSFLLADLIVRNGSKRPSVGKAWLDSERLLLTRDKRDQAEAEALIRWCQDSSFWRPNILSMPKFREQYDRMRLQREAAKEDQAPKSDPWLEKQTAAAA